MGDRRLASVRNAYHPERTLQTGIGDVPGPLPDTGDRSGTGLCFRSDLLPPYLRRTRPADGLLPWLYLKAIASGAFEQALPTLLGESPAINGSGDSSAEPRLSMAWGKHTTNDHLRGRSIKSAYTTDAHISPPHPGYFAKNTTTCAVKAE